MAVSPKRTPSGTTVKWSWLSFRSGGNTAMPRSRHSPMYKASLSVLDASIVSSAAAKCLGKLALRYAVWYARNA